MIPLMYSSIKLVIFHTFFTNALYQNTIHVFRVIAIHIIP